jgi:hypothetical protein
MARGEKFNEEDLARIKNASDRIVASMQVTQ